MAFLLVWFINFHIMHISSDYIFLQILPNKEQKTDWYIG